MDSNFCERYYQELHCNDETYDDINLRSRLLGCVELLNKTKELEEFNKKLLYLHLRKNSIIGAICEEINSNLLILYGNMLVNSYYLYWLICKIFNFGQYLNIKKKILFLLGKRKALRYVDRISIYWNIKYLEEKIASFSNTEISYFLNVSLSKRKQSEYKYCSRSSKTDVSITFSNEIIIDENGMVDCILYPPSCLNRQYIIPVFNRLEIEKFINPCIPLCEEKRKLGDSLEIFANTLQKLKCLAEKNFNLRAPLSGYIGTWVSMLSLYKYFLARYPKLFRK